MYSVIIPTYNKPNLLRLCLDSAIKNQKYNNEYVVVIDGIPDYYINVLDEYKDNKNIKFITFDTNYGFSNAINIGVVNSTNEYVFIINDDNVFSEDWDINYNNMIDNIISENKLDKDSIIFTPNQIENRKSLHNGFVIQNFGTDETNFNMNLFDFFIKEYNKSPNYSTNGSTFPILCTKVAYFKVGGLSTLYPRNGLMADWDFFLKCNLNKYQFFRLCVSPLYHFCESTTNGEERRKQDVIAANTAKRIWGKNINHSYIDNSKSL